jgi:hypothetical protein
LKLKCDEPLSNCAFNFINVRHYTKEDDTLSQTSGRAGDAVVSVGGPASTEMTAL